MAIGVPYDSNNAHAAFAAAICSLLTATAYAESGRIAEVVGPFPGYEANTHSMRRVLQMHSDAASTEAQDTDPARSYTQKFGTGPVAENVALLNSRASDA